MSMRIKDRKKERKKEGKKEGGRRDSKHTTDSNSKGPSPLSDDLSHSVGLERDADDPRTTPGRFPDTRCRTRRFQDMKPDDRGTFSEHFGKNLTISRRVPDDFTTFLSSRAVAKIPSVE